MRSETELADTEELALTGVAAHMAEGHLANRAI